MARTKSEKKEIIEKLNHIMSDAKSIVFTNIHGLKIDGATPMRKKLKQDDVGFFVAKKTLISLAMSGQKYSGQAPELNGEIGIAYSKDLLAPARGVYGFQKSLKDQVSIVGGVFDGRYMNKEEMISIAEIPPAETLYGMFVNIINSPIQGLVMALDQISKKQA